MRRFADGSGSESSASLTTESRRWRELHAAWWEVHEPDIARNTRDAYEAAWTRLIEPRLGQMRLAELTPLTVERFMRDLLDSGVGEASAEKAWIVLSSMFRRAEAWGWTTRNPVRAAKKPRKRNQRRVPRPLAPAEIEAIRAQLPMRDATLISVLGYAGLRPGEALALRWGDIGEETITVARSLSYGDEKTTKTGATRVVRMLGVLRWDLRTWYLNCGRPSDRHPVFPATNGEPWSDWYYRRWRSRIFKPAVVSAGLDPDTRVYDLRHSRATTMIYEGRNPIEIASELGHSPQVLLSTYAHVLAAHHGERIDPQALILEAREELREEAFPRKAIY